MRLCLKVDLRGDQGVRELKRVGHWRLSTSFEDVGRVALSNW